MTNLQKLGQWLQSYPPFAGQPPQVVFTCQTPQGLALTDSGLEEVSRKEDILGRKLVECRLHFALLLQQPGLEDGSQAEAFQQWAQEQSLAQKAPTFGDIPRQERLYTRLRQLKHRVSSGVQQLAVELTAEFTKIY